MKRIKAMLEKKWLYALLLTVCFGIMAFSGVQTSRAALTYVSENYTAEVTVSDIGITLVENGQDVGWRDYTGDGWRESSGTLLGNILAEGENFQAGKWYPEELAVKNTGSIDEYVRVILTRYWENDAGKQTDLDPQLIELDFTDSGWVVDESVSTPERTVLYYSQPLAVGSTTPPLASRLRVSNAPNGVTTETRTVDENGYVTITSTVEYNGMRFMLEAEADGVQTHSAEDAVKSAWGVDVSIGADGSLSLN